jgi:hypothetical protein
LHMLTLRGEPQVRQLVRLGPAGAGVTSIHNSSHLTFRAASAWIESSVGEGGLIRYDVARDISPSRRSV